MRKIIQISAVSTMRMPGIGCFALCDDGTVWLYDNDNKYQWAKLYDIAQHPTVEITVLHPSSEKDIS